MAAVVSSCSFWLIFHRLKDFIYIYIFIFVLFDTNCLAWRSTDKKEALPGWPLSSKSPESLESGATEVLTTLPLGKVGKDGALM